MVKCLRLDFVSWIFIFNQGPKIKNKHLHLTLYSNHFK